jgi:3-deoxy-D-manno-octulosonic-acid transferase
MLLLYNLFSAISLLFYLPRLLSRKGPEERSVYIRERLGISKYSKADIWIHAVSVGETIASLPLLKRLSHEFPGKKIVFSTTTYTGQRIAKDKLSEVARVMYIPWDTGPCVSRVINALSPDIFITLETEIWPLLYRGLRNAGARILIINGRLSEKSYRGYRLIRFFIKRVLSEVDYFFMQSRDDAERILDLGAAEEKVGVMGNLKFDLDLTGTLPPHWVERLNGRILLAGSTHRGEDEIILDAYEIITGMKSKRNSAGIAEKASDLLLILAPRHPERFDNVENILKERGLSYIRRSKMKWSPVSSDSGLQTYGDRLPHVILLDTIGELSQIFSAASVTFIGGSLLPYGGHNILEPAFWGRPIIFGPYMDNFPVAGEFLRSSAALQVKTAEDIANSVVALLEDSDRARQMGENAHKILKKNEGATGKALDLIRSHLEPL